MTSSRNKPHQPVGFAARGARDVRGGFGSKPFRARQLLNWVYKRGEGSIADMTDLAKDFRAQLVASARKFARRKSSPCNNRPTAPASGS